MAWAISITLSTPTERSKRINLMLYSTCTFAPAEDEQTVSWLLENRPDMELAEMEDYEGFSRIVSINGLLTPSFYEVGEVLAQNKDKDVSVGFYRAGVPQTLTLHTDTAGKMGVYSVSPLEIYQTVTRKYGFFESFPAGVMLGVNTLKGYVSDMKYVFTKEGGRDLG